VRRRAVLAEEGSADARSRVPPKSGDASAENVDRYYGRGATLTVLASVPEGLDYDVVAFEAAIKRASHASGDVVREHLEEAAQLYRGEYLPGVEMD
jgi:hypothetical protein